MSDAATLRLPPPPAKRTRKVLLSLTAEEFATLADFAVNRGEDLAVVARKLVVAALELENAKAER